MGQVNVLSRLQEIDSAIQQHKKRLGDVIREQKAIAEIERARQAAKEATGVQQRWRKRQKELQFELNESEQEISRSQNRLYSGDVKNPKELTDLQKKIASLQRRREAIEEEMLEALVEGEEADVAAEEATAELARIEARWGETVKRLQAEQHELALALDKLLRRRDEVLPLVQPGMLARYQNLLQRKNGLAVSRLKRGSCMGCQVRVPAGLAAQAEQGEFVYCNNCGRILSAE